MPGIAAAIAPPRFDITSIMEKMANTLELEGRLHSERLIDAKAGFSCCWSDFLSGFPYSDLVDVQNENVRIIISGHILESSVFSGKHVPEALLRLYQNGGVDFLIGLNGNYSGLILDFRENTQHIFNDRYGINRLFFAKSGKVSYVSSMATAIAAAAPDFRSYSTRAVAELLSCGCTLGNDSLFDGIEIIEAGTVLSFREGELIQRSRYYDPAAMTPRETLGKKNFVEAVIESFGTAVRRSQEHIGHAGAGVSLTGGLDSRMVLAGISDPATLACYCFGSDLRESLDIKIARRITEASNLDFYEIPLDSVFRDDLWKYYRQSVLISDGNLGLGGAAELYVNEKARELAPVRITGSYGSELLRQIRAFKYEIPHPLIVAEDRDSVFEGVMKTFKETGDTLDPTTFVAFYQAQHQSYGRYSVERSQVGIRLPFLDNDLLDVLYSAPLGIDGIELSRRIIEAFRPELLRFESDRGYFGTSRPFAKNLKQKYRQLMFKAEYALGNGMPNRFCRWDKFYRYSGLERFVLGRNKFYHPRPLINSHLENPIRSILADRDLVEQIPLLSFSLVDTMVREHFERRANNTRVLDRILTLAVSMSELRSK